MQLVFRTDPNHTALYLCELWIPKTGDSAMWSAFANWSGASPTADMLVDTVAAISTIMLATAIVFSVLLPPVASALVS